MTAMTPLQSLQQAVDAVKPLEPFCDVLLRWNSVNVVAHEQERAAREEFACASYAHERSLRMAWQAAYEFENASNFHPYHDKETYTQGCRLIESLKAKS